MGGYRKLATTSALVGIVAIALAACSGGGGSGGGGGGSSGSPSVIAAISPSSAPASACPNGGITVQSGIDQNLNGVLDPSEVTLTQYVCNGSPGSTGAGGAAALVSMANEPAGANCPAGGTKVTSGPDANANGVLDASEVTSTGYLCNGTNGTNGANTLLSVTAEAAGANCASGGLKVVSWLDTIANGTLDPSEAASSTTSYVCNGSGNAPSINGVFPSSIFAGRTVAIDVSGDETAWSNAASVDLGAGVTVQSVTAASPTLLQVTASIAPGATLGSRTVTVIQGGQTLTLPGVLNVASPLATATAMPINVKQGGQLVATFSLTDFSVPLDATLGAGGAYPNLAIASPTSGSCYIASATPLWFNLGCYMDILAPVGLTSVRVDSGAPAGTTVPFVATDAVNIVGRTPTGVAAGGSASVAVADNLENAVFSYQPVASSATQFFSFSGPFTNSYGVPASGRIADVVPGGDTPTLVVPTSGTSTQYVLVLTSGAGSVGITRTELVTNASAEAEANDTTAAANPIVLPAAVAASLSSGADVDVFSFTAAAGDVGKSVRVITAPGDSLTDTVVEVLQSNGVTSLGGPSSDGGYHEDFTSAAIPSAGTYFVKVTAGAASGFKAYDPSHTSYVLYVYLQ